MRQAGHFHPQCGRIFREFEWRCSLMAHRQMTLFPLEITIFPIGKAFCRTLPGFSGMLCSWQKKMGLVRQNLRCINKERGIGMAKKRANGEGSIRKRSDGRWEGRYTTGRDPETGKPIYKNVLGKT